MFNYVKESYNELVHKVTWPTFAQLQNSTVVVMVASLIFAIVIWRWTFRLRTLWRLSTGPWLSSVVNCFVTMSETAKQWYVVRTIGGKENKVKEYIESEIRHSHLEEYISQVLIPTEKVYTIRNGKKVSKEKVSYPGYVLIEAAFVGQIPIIIRNIPNVLGFWVTPRRTAAR